MEEKLCLECQNPLRGRSDKRFCDDACRNTYNNRLNSCQNSIVREINGILRKNRKILQDFLTEEKMVKVSKDRLQRNGFNLGYSTHYLDTSKGQRYTFIYEYGYLPLPDDQYLIVKKKR